MKLSDLKELNPVAYEVFLEEIIAFFGKRNTNLKIKDNLSITSCIIWSTTNQGHEVWEQIYDKRKFTLFNKWLKNNPRKQS